MTVRWWEWSLKADNDFDYDSKYAKSVDCSKMSFVSENKIQHYDPL